MLDARYWCWDGCNFWAMLSVAAHTEKQQENDTDEAVAHAVACMKCVFHVSKIDKQSACEQYEHRADGGESAYHTPPEKVAFPKTCIGKCVPKELYESIGFTNASPGDVHGKASNKSLSGQHKLFQNTV